SGPPDREPELSRLRGLLCGDGSLSDRLLRAHVPRRLCRQEVPAEDEIGAMLEIVQDYWVYLLIGEFPHGPLGGLAMTLVIAALSLALTFPSAVLMALARISPFRVISYPATAFVYVVRGMPLLMLIFWVYFFLPIAVGFPISAFW